MSRATDHWQCCVNPVSNVLFPFKRVFHSLHCLLDPTQSGFKHGYTLIAITYKSSLLTYAITLMLMTLLFSFPPSATQGECLADISQWMSSKPQPEAQSKYVWASFPPWNVFLPVLHLHFHQPPIIVWINPGSGPGLLDNWLSFNAAIGYPMHEYWLPDRLLNQVALNCTTYWGSDSRPLSPSEQ